LAVACATGIFLLDFAYLSPRVQAQEQAAMAESAGRAQQQALTLLLAQQKSLLADCRTWASRPEVLGRIGQGLPVEPSQPLPAGNSLCTSQARALPQDPHLAQDTLVWVTDTGGQSCSQLLHGAQASGQDNSTGLGNPSRGRVGDNVADALAAFSKRCCLASDDCDGGIMPLPGSAAVFARHATDSGSGHPGWVWMARHVDPAMLDTISKDMGGQLILISGRLPAGALKADAAMRWIWPDGERGINIAWPAVDALGNSLGYFRASVPAQNIHQQATAGRRVVLIVLSLSVGLVLLTILGTHILVAGPVMRLLRRLQQIESGQRTAVNLTSNLHGEPLVLARRLETAFEKLAHMSRTDQLTGLANRRHFQEVLECFYHQARRYNRPLTLVVMDIDYFKAVNDTGGHQAGDELLKLVAREMEKASRQADLAARLGGDEFALLLPETGADDAAVVAQRIRQEIAAQKTSLSNVEFNITLSMGLADLNAGEIDSPDAMASLADKALYAAKEAGRNQLVMARDLTALAPGEEGKKKNVEVLCKKLAGLDSHFKDLFLQALDEIMTILDHRNPHMANHARKVRHYASLLGQEMGLPPRVIKRIQIAAMLHDIGMVAMPDAILLSSDKLTAQQIELLRQHPLFSVRIMEGMEFLEQEIPTVRYHHERFDGKGYPEGLSGSAIPLTARVLAVADAYDALTSSRPGREARTHDQAIAELKNCAGTQLDPTIVDALVSAAAKKPDQFPQRDEPASRDVFRHEMKTLVHAQPVRE
jgi:diguanylate cyclase (GGDEF)-like protein